MRHHHHSATPAVAACLLGLAAAGVAYAMGRAQTTSALSDLHDDMHEQVNRLDAKGNQLNMALGREFSGVAAGMQNLAEVVNAQDQRFRETLAAVFPNRAQPGGEEPPG